jgi:hypothetical protein
MPRLVVTLLCLVLGTSCITAWNEFPRPTETPAKTSGTLFYEIEEVTGMFGGGEALREAFPEYAPFARVEPLGDPPGDGLFCRVTSERRAPNVASGIAGYVSYAFLFLIPFWSNEGYVVRYQVYVDGDERKIFEYPISRRSFFWALALPVSWVSLLTPSERDAFEGTVKQFFVDLMPYVAGAEAWATPARP